MAGFDTPWMSMGLREDGYPVLDPRDFREVPSDESQQEALAKAIRQQAMGAASSHSELERANQLQKNLFGRKLSGSAVDVWSMLKELEKKLLKESD